MRQRTSAYLSIRRRQVRRPGSPPFLAIIDNVPITAACKRVFKLMEEDYISLEFEQADDICPQINVGDYIEDELFGLFVATKNQLPSYVAKTGGYKYSLQFEREYMVWKNKIFMLTQETTVDNEKVRVRKETSWVLTDVLETHVNEILNNLNVLGYTYNELPYVVKVHNSATKKEEVRCISYESISILDALKKIVDEYETEYWISYENYTENGETEERGIINIGKCEVGDTPIELSLETNLLDISIQSSVSEFANKVYAFGSTKNIPESYRKELTFEVDSIMQGTQNQTYDVDDAKAGALDVYGMVSSQQNCYYIDFIPVNEHDIITYTGTIKRIAPSMGSSTLHQLIPNTSSPLFAIPEQGAMYQLLPADVQSGDTKTYSGTEGQVEIGSGIRGIMAWSVGNNFSVVKSRTIGTIYCDTTKPLKPTMASNGFTSMNFGLSNMTIVSEDNNVKQQEKFTANALFDNQSSVSANGQCTLTGNFSVKIRTLFNSLTSEIPAVISYRLYAENTDNVSNIVYGSSQVQLPIGTSDYDVQILTGSKSFLLYGTYEIKLEVILSFDFDATTTANGVAMFVIESEEEISSLGELTIPAPFADIPMLYNNAIYFIRLNPSLLGESDSMYSYFAFVTSNGELTDEPTGFDNGSTFKLLFQNENPSYPDGLVATKIPYSYFSNDFDDPSSQTSIGENRLRLPLEKPFVDEDVYLLDGYIMNADISPWEPVDKLVEQMVIFDNVFPRCMLYVTEVEEVQKKTKEELSDASDNSWQWTQYKIKCKLLNGNDFVFKRDYIKPGETLQVNFLTEDILQENSDYDTTEHRVSSLAGMTFDVNFKQSTQVFTIVRNNDFGAMLPNDTLKPQVGDCFTLIGWDVRAISMLGLIEDAENELYDKAREYVLAIEENQFVFNCIVKFEYLTGLVPYVPFHTDSDEPTYTTEEDESNLKLYVANDGTFFRLLDEGTKVTLNYLPIGDKTTRIIGYEYKLDFPFDNPKYIIGETDAYSRLKQIEKEISKLS